MTAGTFSAPLARPWNHLAETALTGAARFWYLVTVAGQLIFVAYVVAVYGGAALMGNLQGWNKVMRFGYVPGDGRGNLAIGAHLLMAAIIMVGGAVQLIPHLRSRAPALHRWNGRLYLAGALLAAVSGLYMIWWRGAVGDLVQHLGTSLNAVLILVCAALTLQRALARDIAAHRRWALRLFLCVSGVWFFRIGLMFWIAVHGGPAGFDPTSFTGPFLSFLAFAQYLLPLTVLELYLRSRAHGSATARLAMAAGLTVLTLATGVGIAVATMGMWLPQIQA
jgi:hypothetical protein